MTRSLYGGNMPRWIILIIILFATCFLWAENEIIYEISIEGNQNVEKSLIISSMSIGVGDVISQDAAAKTIKNLYNLGVFDDVSLDAEPYKDGVILTVKVKEYPIVNKIIFEGNKVEKDNKLEELITLKKGSYYSPYLASQARNKIVESYVKKSYNLASASFNVNSLPNNKVDVTVTVHEGEKVAIKSIIFHGNEEVLSKNLIKKMKTKSANLLRSGRFEQDKFDLDLDNIIKYYNTLGYIDARIVSADTVQVDPKYMQIVINLNEGLKYKFGQIRVHGNTRFTEQTIKSKFKFKENDTFDLEKFDKQLQAVSTLYYEEGYIYAQFDHEIEKVGDKVNINLNITENTRAKIHKIIITGNLKTKEKVLRRQLEIAPGDYFQQSRVIKSQQNIYNLGFFEPDMIPSYKPINNNGDIDLTLNVKDKSSGTANGGVGYNSTDKFVGQLSVSENNLFGNAWSSSIKWEFGGTTQNFEYNFTNPNLFDTDMLFGFDLYSTRKEWTSFFYEVSTQGASIRLGFPLYQINRSRIVGSYSYYTKKYRITDRSAIDSVSNANLIELDKLGWTHTSSGSLTYSRDTRDNVFFPTSGSQITFYTEMAGGPFGGDFNYIKEIAQVNWYTETYMKLALRAKWRASFVKSFKGGEEVPPDERFYLGGTGVDGIRGYPDRSVGPSDGGTRAVIFSSELAYPIGGDTVTGLVFFDAGNSYSSLKDFNFLLMKKGIGPGVRIRSPFGLIGFDYAYALDKHTWEPHFQFGTTF
jgi:outer membrane protein insertion porin family